MAIEKSLVQRLKWHVRFVNVSVVEVAGLDYHVLLPCFECC